MRFSIFTTGLLGLSLSSVATAVKSYEGYRTYRISGAGDTAAVRAKLDSIDLDVWEDKLSSSGLVDVMVGPDQIAAFERLGLSTQILHEDLGAAIQEESSVPEHIVTSTTTPPCTTSSPEGSLTWQDRAPEQRL